MISFTRISILDPALLLIVPNTQHLGRVSNEFHVELFFEELAMDCETTCVINSKLRSSSRQWNISMFRWVNSFSEGSLNFDEQSENNLHLHKKNAEDFSTNHQILPDRIAT